MMGAAEPMRPMHFAAETDKVPHIWSKTIPTVEHDRWNQPILAYSQSLGDLGGVYG